MKKTLIKIGMLGAVIAPFSLVVSCSKTVVEKKSGLKPLSVEQLKIINNDMKYFKDFNQSITTPIPMLTLNSYPSQGFLESLAGHDKFRNITIGVQRAFKVIGVNDKGTLHIQITFSIRNHPEYETKSIVYRITGFKAGIILKPLSVEQLKIINNDMKYFKDFNQSITTPVSMLALNSHPSQALLGQLAGHDKFHGITAGVKRDFKVISVSEQGILHIRITFSIHNHPEYETKTIVYAIAGFKTKSGLKPLSVEQLEIINNDMKYFKDFDQTITTPVTMLTLNSHPSQAFLGSLAGHDEFNDITAGVQRDFKVISVNDQGTLHIQITFSIPNHPEYETKSIVYAITGFKTN